MSSSATTATSGVDRTQLRRSLVGTGIGNALEWYDWNVYASFAVYLAAQLFDNTNPTSAFLATMATFAVGFIARPFGGFVFGWLADRIGRKHSLMIAVVCASVGSLLVAICPPYAQFGVLSSALLVVARLIQGLAHGGELPSAQTYLSEQAPREHRGFWASLIYVSGTIGLILGLVLGLVLTLTLSKADMAAWGWRVPFIVGAVLGVFALWIRNQMEESEVFESDVAHSDAPRRNVFADALTHWKTGLQVIGMTCGLTVSYYIWSVSMGSIAKSQFKFDQTTAFLVSLIGNVVFIGCLPLWGKFSDKYGRKPAMLIAMIGAAVFYLPMQNLLQQGVVQAVLAISVMLILLGAFLGMAPAAYAELFPTDVRATGFGVPYAIAIALFGGTAPMLLTAWAGTPWLFPAYAIALAIVSALTILTLPETKGKDLHHHHVDELR